MDGGGIYSGGAGVSHDGAVVGAQEGGFAPRGGETRLYALGECEASTVAAVGHLVGEGFSASREAAVNSRVSLRSSWSR